MHGAAVVPHDEVVELPAVEVEELALRGMGDEFIDERLRLSSGTP